MINEAKNLQISLQPKEEKNFFFAKQTYWVFLKTIYKIFVKFKTDESNNLCA